MTIAPSTIRPRVPRSAASLAVASLVALLALSACGDDREATASDGPPPAAAEPASASTAEDSAVDSGDAEAETGGELPPAVAADVEQCDLLSDEVIASVTGYEVKTAETNGVDCLWELKGASFSIAAEAQNDPAASFGVRDRYLAYTEQAEAEPIDIGDQALYLPSFQAIALEVGGKYATIFLNGVVQDDPAAILEPLATEIAAVLAG